jgi:hypothetical protein
MIMAPAVRKLALTAHVTASVGWLGAVAGSLALGVAGLTLQDPERVRSVYLTLEPMGWYVLVPFSVASLLTGLLQALGTRWGLFRHYWVVAKLLMNVFATLVVVLYMQTLGYLADRAAATGADSVSELRSPSVVLHAGGAVALLLLATVLSVYKPRGLTRYGQRKRQEQRAASRPSRADATAALVP